MWLLLAELKLSVFCTNIQYLVCCFPGKLSHSEEIKGCRKLISHIVAFLICSSVTVLYSCIFCYIYDNYTNASVPKFWHVFSFLCLTWRKRLYLLTTIQVYEWVYSESLLRPLLGITSSMSYVIRLLFQGTCHTLTVWILFVLCSKLVVSV